MGGFSIEIPGLFDFPKNKKPIFSIFSGDWKVESQIRPKFRSRNPSVFLVLSHLPLEGFSIEIRQISIEKPFCFFGAKSSPPGGFLDRICVCGGAHPRSLRSFRTETNTLNKLLAIYWRSIGDQLAIYWRSIGDPYWRSSGFFF